MGFEKLYKEADKYIVINDNDPDLRPVYIKLPSPPDKSKIDGYSWHPDKQIFKRLEIPPKLKQIDSRVMENLTDKRNSITRYKIIEEYWRIIDEEQDILQKEISFLKQVHWYLKHGYWFYCDGKPTWLPPWHFHYLNFWAMPESKTGYPEYRDVDRRNYIAKWYLFTCTETFAKVNNKGRAIRELDGSYKMKDVGYRLFYGWIKSKRRREGATNSALSDNLWIGCRSAKAHTDIVADTGAGAKDLWKDIFIPAWNKIPLFLEPLNDSSSNPTEINLRPPRNVFKQDSLESIFGFTETAGERGNDKRRLVAVLMDEEGKCIEADVRKRWEITKLTLSQFHIIHGWSAHPSTVEDMNEGGYAYEELSMQSDFYVRLPSGTTISGLGRLFNSCWDGMDGYIGAFGESIIESPTERQMRLAPPSSLYTETGKGAKEVIEEDLEFLLRSGTPRDLITYRERIRKNPRQYADCWIGITGDMGWDVIPIDRRIAELKRGTHVRRINLEWIDSNDISKGVRWMPSEEGRFISSQLFLNKSPSLPYYYGDEYFLDENINIRSYRPHNPIGCAGADPFQWDNKTSAKMRDTGSYMSDGGGAGYWAYDVVLDGSMEEDQQQSDRLIWTYLNRVSEKQYFEDMCMSVVFWNMMLLPESNIKTLIKYFKERGLYGYLLRLPDIKGGLKNDPGYYTQDKSEIFGAIREYSARTINRELHVEVLQDMRDIKGTHQMTKYDRLVAVGLALIGAKSMGYIKSATPINHTGIDIDISGTEFDYINY